MDKEDEQHKRNRTSSRKIRAEEDDAKRIGCFPTCSYRSIGSAFHLSTDGGTCSHREIDESCLALSK